MNRLACALLMVLSATALGEDPKAKAAREELERQLNQMVGKVPTRVRIDFLSLDEPNYIIEEATFELDGRTLRSPAPSELSDDGTHPVWSGEVTPGRHSVKVTLVVANRTSAVLSDEGGYKWTLRGERTADVHAGIEVRVEVTARRDGSQPDVGKRFTLATTAKPVMIAQLDDGSIPEPPKKPVIAAVVDAGAPAPTADQLAQAKAAEAAEAKRLVEEEKKAKAAAAAEAKRLADEEKKARAAEALEAKRAAAAAKKEKAAAALAAKKAAAEEKKRLAAEAAAEKKRLAEEKKLAAAAAAEEKKRALEAKNAPVAPEPAPEPVAAAEPVDAGVPEEVDAGAPEVVAVAPVDAGVAAPTPAPTEEEEGPPWLLIGIAGAVGALIFLVVVARRRARPPTLDD